MLMYFSSEYNPWMTFIHLFISLFDTTLAKYLFYALVLLVLALLSLKKKSYGEESPKIKEAEQAAEKITKYLGRIIIYGASGFVVFQLTRVYILD